MNYFALLEIARRMKNKQNKLCKKILEETGVHYTTLEIIVLLYSDSTVTTAKEVCEYLNLKPNLHVDTKGKLIPIGKVRGRTSSIKKLFKSLSLILSFFKLQNLKIYDIIKEKWGNYEFIFNKRFFCINGFS